MANGYFTVQDSQICSNLIVFGLLSAFFPWMLTFFELSNFKLQFLTFDISKTSWREIVLGCFVLAICSLTIAFILSFWTFYRPIDEVKEQESDQLWEALIKDGGLFFFGATYKVNNKNNGTKEVEVFIPFLYLLWIFPIISLSLLDVLSPAHFLLILIVCANLLMSFGLFLYWLTVGNIFAKMAAGVR